MVDDFIVSQVCSVYSVVQLHPAVNCNQLSSSVQLLTVFSCPVLYGSVLAVLHLFDRVFSSPVVIQLCVVVDCIQLFSCVRLLTVFTFSAGSLANYI